MVAVAPPVASPSDVVGFWRQAGPKKWFAKDPAFDAVCRARFESLHYAAARRELDAWSTTPEGSLALILLLDQIPRNLWRGTAHAFATDPLALAFAEQAIEAGHDRRTANELRIFYYLPLEHSERIEDQDRCERLVIDFIAEGGDPDFLKWVRVHRDVIARFGRFPHRNPMLGRETTPQERAFLDAGGWAG
jgi:uncharacterized protein (DUF924 family)